MLSDFLKLIGQRLQISLQVETGNTWSEVIEKAKKHEIDVVACLTETEERKTFLNFTNPYLSFPWVIITRSDYPIIGGIKDGQKTRYTIDMFDEYCPQTDVISMARTTGYTATMALWMIAKGLYTQKGVSPPEFIGKYPDCVEFMQQGLEERNVFWRQ